MGFTVEQIAKLQEPLAPALVATRQQAGQTLRYLEGYAVIDAANRILGLDGWSYSVDRLDAVPVGDGQGMLYMAIVTVSAGGVTRQDVGADTITNSLDRKSGEVKDNVGNADRHVTACKAAVTDALKRALRTFGDQFGNVLYGDSDLITERRAWLESEIAGLLAEDDEAAGKVTTPLREMSAEALEKMLTRLQERAEARARTPEQPAPRTGPPTRPAEAAEAIRAGIDKGTADITPLGSGQSRYKQTPKGPEQPDHERGTIRP